MDILGFVGADNPVADAVRTAAPTPTVNLVVPSVPLPLAFDHPVPVYPLLYPTVIPLKSSSVP